MEFSSSFTKEGEGSVGGQEMSPEVSLRLFKEGATFVLLDVPLGTEFGIDMATWNTGERFKGVKMIPPGLHFIYFSAVSKDLRSTAPRTGFFHLFQKKELLAKKYDPKAEDISVKKVSEEDQTRMKEELEGLDMYLGAYPYNIWRTWISLTSKITEDILKKLSPPSGRILSAPELILDADQSRPSTSRRRMTELEKAEDALPKMTENVESKITYTNIPTESYPEGATPQQVSKHQLDQTWKLLKVLNTMSRPIDYLAELQFAFITFLVGQHYESFEHWKSMVHLLCHSNDAMLSHSHLYLDFISDLYFQIKEIPEDFFVDIVASNNFLFSCMQRLINNVKEHDGIDSKLRNKAERFSTFLTSKFGWDFEEEYDDAPTIVSEEEATLSTERSCLKRKTTDTKEESPPEAKIQSRHDDLEDLDIDNDIELEATDMIGDLPMF